MEIKWHGLSCLSFQGKAATFVTDPYDPKVAGIKMPKISADVCLANADFELHHAILQLGKDVKVFDWPGEYEMKNIIVQALSAHNRPREKDESKKDDAQKVLVFSVKLDGFKICHLSNIGHKLTPEMLEVIGDVDILTVPVGGEGCLDAQKAHEVIEQIDPRVIIPMYYNVPGLKLSLAELDLFLKEVGLHTPQHEKSLKFQTPSQLPQGQAEFKILEPSLG